MLGFKIIKIQGHSMEPVLKAGSYALVKSSDDFQNGDLVLFQIDGYPQMIKRIIETENNMYFLTGDNKNDSLDSRTFGWVPKVNILGKVIWH